MNQSTTKQCPYCKEEILKEAILCKHCRSKLVEEGPSHGGICPYCKESIKEDAIKCKHCLSNLQAKDKPCDCSSDPARVMRLIRPGGFGTSPTGGSDCLAEYENCYLDCSYDHPTDSLGQFTCLKRCDRKYEICDVTGHWPRLRFVSGFMRI